MPYDPNEIVQITHTEAILKRPGLYLGGIDLNALHHMVFEILDGAIDFALAGTCDHITISLHKDNVVCIQDNGPGISIRQIVGEDKSLIEMICLYGHITDTDDGLGPYCVQGGLHGIGISAINALSAWMIVEDRRNGMLQQVKFQCGEQQGSLQLIRGLSQWESTGLSVTFKPDFTILVQNDFDFDRISERCHETAYQIPGLTLLLRDERTTPSRTRKFNEPQGVGRLVATASEASNPVNEPIIVELSNGRRDAPFRYNHMECHCALVFTRERQSAEFGHVNTVQTTYGGTHIDGLRQGLLRFFNNDNQGEAGQEFHWEDVDAHLVSAVSVFHGNPQFTSLRRVELQTPDVTGPIAYAVYLALGVFATEHPDQWQEILEICRGAAR